MIRILAGLLLAFATLTAHAQANLEVGTPAINNIKKAMADRHAQLAAHYASGAIGIARDGPPSLS